MVQATQTVGRELLLAASLLARPEYVTALYPRGDTAAVTHSLAREIIAVLATQGPAYASPGAMEAALADRGVLDEDNLPDFAALVNARPLRDEVVLKDLISIKEQVEEEASARRLATEAKKIASLLALKPDTVEEAASQLRKALQEHGNRNRGVGVGARDILGRMSDADTNVRWKLGFDILDQQAEGVGPDGNYGYGALGQGETSVLLAPPGTGKTRVLLNIVANLLDQGAGADIVALEDSDTAYLAKLLGVRFGLTKAQVLRYARSSKDEFVRVYGSEVAAQVEAAQAWAEEVHPRLRIYDEKNRSRVGNFNVMMNVLEESVALNQPNFIAVDYINAVLKSPDITEVEARVQEVRAFANRNNVHVMMLSQMSGENIKNGVAAGIVAAKGTTEIGQAVHWAWQLEMDPEVGQRELKVVQQKGRDAGLNLCYLEMDPPTGKITRAKGTADHMSQADFSEPVGRRGTKKGGRQ